MTKKHLTDELTENLVYLKLPWIRENYEELTADAAAKEWLPMPSDSSMCPMILQLRS